MDETLINKMFETFDKLDENECALVINQVARRMMVLRCNVPDASFWYSTLLRIARWLSTTPTINEVEKEMLIDPPFVEEKRTSGRVQAMKHMRERSGTQLSACMKIVDAWVENNLEVVHPIVKASWLSTQKNRLENNK